MYTPIKLDKTRNIMLGFEAMRLYKSMTGKSLTKIDFEQEDIEDVIPLIIYCGLKHEDDSLTLEETIKLIDKNMGIKKVIELMPTIFKDAGLGDDDIKNAQRAAKKK